MLLQLVVCLLVACLVHGQEDTSAQVPFCGAAAPYCKCTSSVTGVERFEDLAGSQPLICTDDEVCVASYPGCCYLDTSRNCGPDPVAASIPECTNCNAATMYPNCASCEKHGLGCETCNDGYTLDPMSKSCCGGTTPSNPGTSTGASSGTTTATTTGSANGSSHKDHRGVKIFFGLFIPFLLITSVMVMYYKRDSLPKFGKWTLYDRL